MLVEGHRRARRSSGPAEAGARAQPDAARRDGRLGRGDVRARALPHRQPRRRRHRRHRLRVRAVPLRARDAHGTAVGDVDAAGVPRAAPHARHRPWTYGLATGACIALQMLSSIYYGIFLATPASRSAAAAADGPRSRGAAAARAARRSPAGPCSRRRSAASTRSRTCATHERVGDRSAAEVAAFSARPSSYLAATPTNWLYGSRRAGGRRSGAPAVSRERSRSLLAIVGLLLRAPSRRAIVYLLLLVAAFETSLGFDGYSYSFLYEHVSGLSRPARGGAARDLRPHVPRRCWRRTATRRSSSGRAPVVRRGRSSASLALRAPGRVPRHARARRRIANATPPVYRMLAQQPRGVVAEFPVPRADALPGDEPEYAYMSTFHWFPLVNGYSGIYPRVVPRAARAAARTFRMSGRCRQLRSDQRPLRHRARVGVYRPDDLAALQLSAADSVAVRSSSARSTMRTQRQRFTVMR